MRARHTKEYLSIPDAATDTGLSQSFWRKAIRSKQIPYYKMGRLVKIARSDLEGWIESRRISACGAQRNDAGGHQ